MKLAHVKAHLRHFRELGNRDIGIGGENGQAVRFGDVKNIVGSQQMGRPGHVLQDQRRFAGKVFPQMMGDDLAGDFETAAFGADQNRHGFSFEKIGLCPNRAGTYDQPSE